MDFKEGTNFLEKKKTEKNINIGNENYKIESISENITGLNIDKNNDWRISFKLKDKEDKSHKLELVWNETTDLVFVGAFFDEAQIDESKIS